MTDFRYCMNELLKCGCLMRQTMEQFLFNHPEVNAEQMAVQQSFERARRGKGLFGLPAKLGTLDA